MDLNTLSQATIAILIPAAWKLAGAIALWLVARGLIKFSLRLMDRALARQGVDATLGGTCRQVCRSS